ncbi:MAG: hypothetical protein QM484_06255 [Woeseiaceae bacterium]
MLQLIKVFWSICRFKAAPQDLPVARNLLIAAVIAGIFVDSFGSSLLMKETSAMDVAITVTIFNVVLLFSLFLLLKAIGFKERAMQTLTAVAGSGLLISLVLLPSLLFIYTSVSESKSYAFYILIDNIWRISVNAHILRHALSIGLLMATIISLSYLIFGVMVADYLLSFQQIKS